MKKQITLLIVSAISLVVLLNKSSAQCTTANINWDQLDYLERNSSGYSTYITSGMYANMVQQQSFAIGVNRLTIVHNYATANNLGEGTSHTGETGSYGAGADVQYIGNGLITLTFDVAVSNVRFSLYDIDRSQRVQFGATDGATARNIILTRLGTSILTIYNNNTSSARVEANSTIVNNSSVNAAVNVDIAGPVTAITLTVTNTNTGTNENGRFFLSDIAACVTGAFPSNYYAISQPFTGQPAYVLAVHDLNTVYMIDPATGRATSLFTDTDPRVSEINDLAYDPYKRIVYYSVDGLERCTPVGNPDSIRHVKKYDVNTEATPTVLISNVNNAPLNIPTFSYGLESASGAFYNGSYFLGAEGTQSGSTNTGREGIVWRIDFAADSITPTKACQVFAQPVDNGSSLLHDWGDITIKDGLLYDFNATSASAVGNYNIYNLQTQVITNTYLGLTLYNKPRQAAQQWNGNLLWLHDSIGSYNGTNVLTSKQRIVAASGSVPWVAGAGDAAEAFRPKADFGDAPSTYDPVALSPALHERDTSLFIGTSFISGWDWEWNKNTSSDATGDGVDDNDGLLYTPIFDKAYGNYLAYARVYNNTGANATLIAWFDYNGDGDYDASEALTPITVPSSAAVQGVYLYWPSISSSIPNGNYTFLRIRLTTESNGMTASNPTGYFSNGEVEDYRVLVDNFPLNVKLISFDAKAVNGTMARLTWSTNAEDNLSGFDIERSTDGVSWDNIGFVNATGNGRGGTNEYVFNDLQVIKGKSYYRLKLKDNNMVSRYSDVRNIFIKNLLDQVTLMPNPAKNSTAIYINSTVNINAIIVLTDMQGRKLRTLQQALIPGSNSILLDNLERYPNGTYIVQVITSQETETRKLIIGKPVF